jgi:excinuclease UvrABC ATPase subunit
MTRARVFGPARTLTGTLAIRGATAYNLRDVDVDIPLEVRASRAATKPRTKRRL